MNGLEINYTSFNKVNYETEEYYNQLQKSQELICEYIQQGVLDNEKIKIHYFDCNQIIKNPYNWKTIFSSDKAKVEMSTITVYDSVFLVDMGGGEFRGIKLREDKTKEFYILKYTNLKDRETTISFRLQGRVDSYNTLGQDASEYLVREWELGFQPKEKMVGSLKDIYENNSGYLYNAENGITLHQTYLLNKDYLILWKKGGLDESNLKEVKISVFSPTELKELKIKEEAEKKEKGVLFEKYYSQSKEYLSSEDITSAREELDKASEIFPYENSYLEKVNTLRKSIAREEERLKQKRYFDLINKGDHLLHDYKFSEAEAIYRKAGEMYPDRDSWKKSLSTLEVVKEKKINQDINELIKTFTKNDEKIDGLFNKDIDLGIQFTRNKKKILYSSYKTVKKDVVVKFDNISKSEFNERFEYIKKLVVFQNKVITLSDERTKDLEKNLENLKTSEEMYGEIMNYKIN